MIVKFTNNKAIKYLNAIETEEYFNGSSRRTLTVYCDTNAISVNELNTLLSSESNVSTITLINEEEIAQSIFTGYVLKLKVSIEPVLVESEATETPAVYQDQLIFKMGKRTYIEDQLAKLGL